MKNITKEFIIEYFIIFSIFVTFISISTNIPFIYGNKVDNITDNNCTTTIIIKKFFLFFKLSFNNSYILLFLYPFINPKFYLHNPELFTEQ